MVTSSVVVFAVRKEQPQGDQDLGRPREEDGVEVIEPDIHIG